MTVPARVSFVTLGVADVEAATRFYTALGWTPSTSSVAGVVTFIGTPNCVLALYGAGALADDAGLPPYAEPPPFRGVALAVNVDSEAAVEAVIDEAVAAGATALRPAAKTDWGGYSGYFADPDGHAWEVAYNPFMPFDAAGRVTLP